MTVVPPCAVDVLNSFPVSRPHFGHLLVLLQVYAELECRMKRGCDHHLRLCDVFSLLTPLFKFVSFFAAINFLGDVPIYPSCKFYPSQTTFKTCLMPIISMATVKQTCLLAVVAVRLPCAVAYISQAVIKPIFFDKFTAVTLSALTYAGILSSQARWLELMGNFRLHLLTRFSNDNKTNSTMSL